MLVHIYVIQTMRRQCYLIAFLLVIHHTYFLSQYIIYHVIFLIIFYQFCYQCLPVKCLSSDHMLYQIMDDSYQTYAIMFWIHTLDILKYCCWVFPTAGYLTIIPSQWMAIKVLKWHRNILNQWSATRCLLVLPLLVMGEHT